MEKYADSAKRLVREHRQTLAHDKAKAAAQQRANARADFNRHIEDLLEQAGIGETTYSVAIDAEERPAADAEAHADLLAEIFRDEGFDAHVIMHHTPYAGTQYVVRVNWEAGL